MDVSKRTCELGSGKGALVVGDSLAPLRIGDVREVGGHEEKSFSPFVVRCGRVDSGGERVCVVRRRDSLFV